ncbi:iron-hydroxamate ABC transporter substrate-binding protein [Dethiothermospora halolimnae]|uniref:iron-hydroxamate ABC transporter substrate-binding protein n=1 Tax=Dethiothermospora halolimnae TaxID=3114390 RepID=UPI003CCBF442
MKKVTIIFLIMFALIFSACDSETVQKEDGSITNDEKSETITYESENGPVEVPANPQRIVVLNSFMSGGVMALDGNIVGIDEWSKGNPRYEKYIKDAVEVSDESLEKIIELEPDLIIVPSASKNIDKLKKIAPTVNYTYGELGYLEKFLEIGKLLNKEKEAQEWIDDFKKRAKKAGEEIKSKIGADATVSVIESFEKQLYVFGDNWGRATEIIYQEMDLKMPEKVKEMALEDGYYAMSPEVLPEYAGDYIIFSKNPDANHSFQETDTYKNIPAVKNNRVFEANSKEFYFNDPITLDYQLDFIKKSFLGE